jgi:hypothetical protein
MGIIDIKITESGAFYHLPENPKPGKTEKGKLMESY